MAPNDRNHRKAYRTKMKEMAAKSKEANAKSTEDEKAEGRSKVEYDGRNRKGYNVKNRGKHFWKNKNNDVEPEEKGNIKEAEFLRLTFKMSDLLGSYTHVMNGFPIKLRKILEQELLELPIEERNEIEILYTPRTGSFLIDMIGDPSQGHESDVILHFGLSDLYFESFYVQVHGDYKEDVGVKLERRAEGDEIMVHQSLLSSSGFIA